MAFIKEPKKISLQIILLTFTTGWRKLKALFHTLE
jgi:hypothetical protein